MILTSYGTVVVDETERGEITQFRLRGGKILISAHFQGPLPAREASVGVQVVVFGEDGSVIYKGRVAVTPGRPAVEPHETYIMTQQLGIIDVEGSSPW